MRTFFVWVCVICAGCLSRSTEDNCGLPIPADPTDTTAPNYGAHFYPQNFSYESAPITPALDVDFDSFTTMTSLDPVELNAATAKAVAYWNSAGANFTITTGSVLCSDSDSTGAATISGADRACVSGLDGFSTLMLDHGTPYPGAAATAQEVKYLDPDKTGRSHSCLVAADIFFHDQTDDPCQHADGSLEDVGVIAINWVLDVSVVVDSDCADHTKDKPFYNTLVHELGHFIGLGHPEASLQSSVVNQDGCSSCDWETISEADITSAKTLYP